MPQCANSPSILDHDGCAELTILNGTKQIQYSYRNKVKVFDLDRASSTDHCLVVVIEPGSLHWDEPAGMPITESEFEDIKEGLELAHEMIHKKIKIKFCSVARPPHGASGRRRNAGNRP